MVSGRRRQLTGQEEANGYNKYDHVDLENGNGSSIQSRPRQRFRDAVETSMSQGRAMELKKKLLENVDSYALEKFRKSDEEVGATQARKIHCSSSFSDIA